MLSFSFVFSVYCLRINQSFELSHTQVLGGKWIKISLLCSTDDCVSYHDLEQLPWLFEGKADLQFDIYRDMRKATRCVSIDVSELGSWK